MIDHLGDDILVGLALDDLDPSQRADALEHLRSCGACRASYDGTRLAVEAVLPAAPVLEPSPGFDARVLAAMGMADSRPPTEAEPTPVARLPERRRAWLLPAAAALVIGMALGAGATWYAAREDPQVAAATIGTPLAKDDGSAVGSVSGAWAEGEPVVVIAVTDAPPGAHYTCRVRLADSDDPVDVGDWTLADGSGTWVVPDLDVADVAAVEMVRDDGTVWATADL